MIKNSWYLLRNQNKRSRKGEGKLIGEQKGIEIPKLDIDEEYFNPKRVLGDNSNFTVTKIPEEINIQEKIIDESTQDKSIQTRVITKTQGNKKEITKIITVKKENEQPETTVSVTEYETPIEEISDIMPKRELGEKSKLSIVETPSEVKIHEIISEESTPEKTVKRRTIRKRAGKKQEVVEIVTVQEENKQPETTVSVTEFETPIEEISDIMPKRELGEKSKLSIVETPSEVKIHEIISEESTPEKTVKRRTIRKRAGKKQEVVEIVTVQEENKQPETTVSVTEYETPIEEISDIMPKRELGEKSKLSIVETPSEVKIHEIISEESTPEKTVKRRTIRKRAGKKQEVVEIVTVQEENKQPETTVSVTEYETPIEEISDIMPKRELGEKSKLSIVETPSEVKIHEIISEESTPEKTVKRRTIRKRAGKKQEVVEIVTVQEENKQPETTVSVTEYETPIEEISDIMPKRELGEKSKLSIVETPSEVKIHEIISEESTPEKTVKRRTIRKRAGKKQEVVEIVTVQEENKQPETTVSVTEYETPIEEISDIMPKRELGEKSKLSIVETPSEVKIHEIISEESTPEKTVKRRTIRKRAGKKQEVVEIVTVQEENKQPETTVSVTEYETPIEEISDIMPKRELGEKSKLSIVETPSEVKIHEIISEESTPEKTVKRRTIRKRAGKKQEVVEIVTVQEENKQPETTVSVTEYETPIEEISDIMPKRELGEKSKLSIVETPSEVKIHEIISEESTPEKTVKRRTIRKRAGKKQEVVEIVTVQEENKQPETTVSVTEYETPIEEISDIMPKRELGEKSKLSIVETPSEVKIHEIISEESTPEKTVKRRTIRKRAGKKQEVVEIVTVQEENKQPETTVSVTEYETPIEEISDIMPKRELGEKSKLSIVETPSEVKIHEIISEESTPEKTVKRRTIRKRAGKKQEVVEIVTVQEENKQPETTVSVTEYETPIEEISDIMPKRELGEKSKLSIVETPSEVKIHEIISEESTPEKTVKRRTIRKRAGKKQEVVEIVTVQEENKQPETTVSVTEYETPIEEISDIMPKRELGEKSKLSIVETPSEVKIHEIISEESTPEKTVKRRTIRKRAGKKQEVVEIVTVQEENKQPETTVSVTEYETPIEEISDIMPKRELGEKSKLSIVETPSEVKIHEIISEESTPEKTVKRRTIRKRAGKKQEVVEIVTVQEENKQPETTVSVTEYETPIEEISDIMPKRELGEKSKLSIVETPSEVKIHEIISEESTPEKTVKRRTIRKRAGKKQEVVEIVTVQEENKQPETTRELGEKSKLSIVETPSEVKIHEIISEESTPEKTVKRRTIRKRAGKKQEVVEIVTVQEENKQPETTVSVTEYETPIEEISDIMPKRELGEKSKLSIVETPSEVKIHEIISEESTPEKTVKRRTIRKRAGKKQEVVEIVTVQEENKQPETTVSVTEYETPIEEISDIMPKRELGEKSKLSIVETPSEVKIHEIISEESTPEKTVKRRTIRKRAGKKQEVVEIVTVQEENKQPETTVSVTEYETPIEEISDIMPKRELGEKSKLSIVETPSEVKIHEIISEESTPEKTVKRRTIRKRAGKKQEVVEIVTVQEENKQPETTVSVTEYETPIEEISDIMPKRELGEKSKLSIVETPSEVKIHEIISEESTPEKTVKRRTIRKRAGKKQEVVEIVTVQEENKQPETTVSVTEYETPIEEISDIMPKRELGEKSKLSIVETPSEVKIHEIISEESTPEKTVKRRTIRKRAGKKQEVVEIVTVQEENKQPETTVSVTEYETPIEEISDIMPKRELGEKSKLSIVETPSEVKIHEIISEESTPEKTVKRRTIRKRAGKKQEVVEIVTVQEENKQPETTVSVTEYETPIEEISDIMPKRELGEKSKLSIVETPSEVKIHEIISEESTPEKTVKRRTIRKRAGKKQEVVEIVTVQEENKQPETTVSVTEYETPIEEISDIMPKRELGEKSKLSIVETPSEVKIHEIISEESTPEKTVKRRTIRKRAGKKQEVVEIVTVQEENKQPETTVSVTEYETPIEEISDIMPKRELGEKSKLSIVETPSEVKIHEIISEESTPEKTVKRRTIRKRAGKKQEVVEIVTVQEENKQPETTVSVTEYETPIEEISDIMPKRELGEKSKLSIVETPSEVKIHEIISEESTPEKTVKRRTIRKRAGKKQEVVEIVTVQEENKQPETTVSVTEFETPIEEISDIMPKRELGEKSKLSIVETPSEVKIHEIISEESTPEKTVKRRTIRKRAGKKQEVVEIVTVQEENKQPETTVSVTEYETPIEEISDIMPKRELGEKSKLSIVETPSEVKIHEIISEESTPEKTVKRRTIRKRAGKKQEVVEIVTVQEENKQPETTVSVTEFETPIEEISDIMPKRELGEKSKLSIVETPSEVKIHEIISEESTPEKTVKRRTIRKRAGKKQEVVEIVTVQEENKQPETTVSVTEFETPIEEISDIMPKRELGEKSKLSIVETPSEVKIHEIISEESTPEKTVKRRTIRKRAGKKQEVVEIVTVQEENKQPETTVSVTEFETPIEEISDIMPKRELGEKSKLSIVETPSEVKIHEIISEESTPEKTVKRRTIRKRAGKKQEVVEIVTVQEENKQPETTVSVTEFETPIEEISDIMPKRELGEKSKLSIVETPSEVKIHEIISEESTPEKTVKRRTIRKRAGKKQEVVEIVTVQEENKQPETTVSVTEFETPTDEEISDIMPKRELGEKSKLSIVETPSEVKIHEIISEESTPEKTVKRRTIRKRAGKKQEVVEIVTVQEENKQPETTVSVTEFETPIEEISDIMPKRELGEKSKNLSILKRAHPEVKIHEKTVKRRTIRKRAGKKQEVVEIVTVQEENKQPETTVSVTEFETPIEEISDIMPKRELGEKSKLSIVETPSEVKIHEIISEESTPEKTVKRRTIRKRAGKKQEVVEIVTVQEENKQPETTRELGEKSKLSIVETPSEVKIHEIISEESTPEKTVKRRTIRKRAGKKQEVVEIVTVQEENKQPETTVSVTEMRHQLKKSPILCLSVRSKKRDKLSIVETPSDVKIHEIITEESTPEKTVKRRTIKKNVLLSEMDIPLEEIEDIAEDKMKKLKTKKTVEEVPDDVKISEIVTEEQTPEKSIKKRVIKKKVGKKQEITEIVTVQEQNKQPQTTVSVVEMDIPLDEIEDIAEDKMKKLKTKKTVEEVPDDVKISEIVTEEQTPEKSIKKRVIKKTWLARNKKSLKLSQFKNRTSNHKPQLALSKWIFHLMKSKKLQKIR
ncbi:titin-like [Chironomus tepperi]|uniref:titin-like n=1 Tax=Chironomus tepperi TaxID=113505 RepID=UPI00391F5854